MNHLKIHTSHLKTHIIYHVLGNSSIRHHDKFLTHLKEALWTAVLLLLFHHSHIGSVTET